MAHFGLKTRENTTKTGVKKGRYLLPVVRFFLAILGPKVRIPQKEGKFWIWGLHLGPKHANPANTENTTK